MKMFVSILLLITSLFSADTKDITLNSNISVRPHFGIGSDNSKHYGLRLLLDTNTKQSYGLDVTHFQTKDDKFNSIGIILEQKLFGWLHMSIGTVGYFDYKDQNTAGLTYGLGWVPNNFVSMLPFIILRGDSIFINKKTETIHSISLGLKYKF